MFLKFLYIPTTLLILGAAYLFLTSRTRYFRINFSLITTHLTKHLGIICRFPKLYPRFWTYSNYAGIAVCVILWFHTNLSVFLLISLCKVSALRGRSRYAQNLPLKLLYLAGLDVTLTFDVRHGILQLSTLRLYPTKTLPYHCEVEGVVSGTAYVDLARCAQTGVRQSVTVNRTYRQQYICPMEVSWSGFEGSLENSPLIVMGERLIGDDTRFSFNRFMCRFALNWLIPVKFWLHLLCGIALTLEHRSHTNPNHNQSQRRYVHYRCARIGTSEGFIAVTREIPSPAPSDVSNPKTFKFKKRFRHIIYYSMPSSVLFVLRRRLNFLALGLTMIVFTLYTGI
jgi:hypothetical protein